MTLPEPKPLLARDDLPLDAIAEICRRWGVLEMAVDANPMDRSRSHHHPSRGQFHVAAEDSLAQDRV